MASAAIRLEMQGAISAFRWDQANFKRILTGSHGLAARDLVRRAIQIERAAKENASGRPGPNVVTGRLRGSITWALGEDMMGVYVDIGTAVEYGLYLEEGTVNMPPYPFLKPALEAGRL